MAQKRSTSATVDTEDLKSRIVDKIKYVNYYYKCLHVSIQSTICPTEDVINVHVSSLDIYELKAIYIASNQK